MKKSILFIGLLFCLGCASFYSGICVPSVSLTNANFKNLGRATGEAKTYYFLFLGGANHNNLVEEARNNIFQNYYVPKNALLANVTTDFKRSVYFFVREDKAILTADVIVLDSNSQASLKIKTQTKYIPKTYHYDTFDWKVGQIVEYELNGVSQKVVIKDIYPSINRVSIAVKDSINGNRDMVVNPNVLFKP